LAQQFGLVRTPPEQYGKVASRQCSIQKVDAARSRERQYRRRNR
jgi:hypothetical protein